MALKNEMSNIRIVQGPVRNSEQVALTKATTTDTFAVGDMVEADSKAGTCKVVNDADIGTFVGISQTTSLTGGLTDKIHISLYGVAQMKTSGALYFGHAAAWSAGANGTDWTVVNAAADGMFHCLSEYIASGGTGDFIHDAYTARVVTGLSFFELPTA